MADISMCRNESCKLKKKCYRYTAIPSEFRQSYGLFALDENGKCNYFWDNKEYNNAKTKK